MIQSVKIKSHSRSSFLEEMVSHSDFFLMVTVFVVSLVNCIWFSSELLVISLGRVLRNSWLDFGVESAKF